MDYFPKVIQVIPTADYKVYVYFDDGNIKLYDANKLITKGIFKQLQQRNIFIETCTVINDTLAWTPDRSYDPSTCLDIDPFTLYECETVEEPEHLFIMSGEPVCN